jgi:hypothetical protein
MAVSGPDRKERIRRHVAGVAALRELFGWTPEEDARLQKEKHAFFPRKERQRRRERNRIARASRKGNRP